jgi:hyperosmotically inducible periplasmic protein
MTREKGLRNIWTIILATAVLASSAMFAEGCNTSQPPNRQVSDSQITTQVKAKLASDVRPSSLTDIDVNTTNGVVTLAGQVEDAEVKHSAETVTASVPGVVAVNNNLQVATAAAPVTR